ncbi:MAG: hypothetical protein ACLR3C_16525 [Eggerthella lenta]
MVQTLIQATGFNRSSEARDGKARGRAFITLLFAVIALSLLLALLVARAPTAQRTMCALPLTIPDWGCR